MLHGDTGWLTKKNRSYFVMLRFSNRLIATTYDIVTEKTFNWDYENDVNGW